MGLAITIGVVIALAIGLTLWARGAIASAHRRHEAQVRANAAAEAARYLRSRSTHTIRATNPDAFRKASAAVPRPSDYTPRRAASTYAPSRSSSYDDSPSWSDFGSSSSYHSGGSCSSGGGDSGGGGCD